MVRWRLANINGRITIRFIIDFETTDLKTRCPIQVGLIVVDQNIEIIREFESLIKPFKAAEWSAQAEAVHGIKQSQLKNSPSIENVALMLAGIFKVHESWVGKNELIYHANGEFDIKILNDLFIRGGLMGSGMPINWCTYNTLKEARKQKLMILNVEPCAKPRMTQSDRWKKRTCVVKYFSFKDSLNMEASKKGYRPTIPLSIIFVITMPKSWSKRKKEQMNGKPHKSRPDLDNLIKAFKDALLKEDSHVWQYGLMEKRWGEIGKIIIHQ